MSDEQKRLILKLWGEYQRCHLALQTEQVRDAIGDQAWNEERISMWNHLMGAHLLPPNAALNILYTKHDKSYLSDASDMDDSFMGGEWCDA